MHSTTKRDHVTRNAAHLSLFDTFFRTYSPHTFNTSVVHRIIQCLLNRMTRNSVRSEAWIFIALIGSGTARAASTRRNTRGQKWQPAQEQHGSHQTIRNALIDRLSHQADRNGGDRDLKDDSTSSVDLTDFACETITLLLPGLATCDCSMSLSINYDCAFQEQICLGGDDGFCSAPLVAGTLGLLDSTYSFEFCAASATNQGISVPGLCISFENATQKDAKARDSSRGDSVGDDKRLTTCSASIGGVPCSSCEICADGNGYMFDCSAHQPGVVQSECTSISVVDSLTQDHRVVFLPNLDWYDIGQ